MSHAKVKLSQKKKKSRFLPFKLFLSMKISPKYVSFTPVFKTIKRNIALSSFPSISFLA